MKFVAVSVVCVAFFIQVNQSTASVPNIQDVLSDPEYDPLSPTARDLVATMLDHITTMLRNDKASKALITIAKNTEKVFTDQSGQNNIMAILDLIGFLLKDPNASKIITICCEKADILVTTKQGRAFLRSMIVAFHRVLTTSNVVGAATSALDGFEKFLQSINPQQMVKLLTVVKKLALKNADESTSADYDSQFQAREINNDFSYTQAIGPASTFV